MENYAKKLMMLLRRKMNAPVESRVTRRYLNPVINNTGQSAGRIQYALNRQEDKLNINIVGDDYLKNIDKGGVPDSGVNVTDIAEWIVSKPIGYRDAMGNVTTNYSALSASHPDVLQLAERITKKIMSKGIDPTGFITKTVDQHLNNLKVIAPVVEDVKDNVVDILKEAGYNLDGKTVTFV